MYLYSGLINQVILKNPCIYIVVYTIVHPNSIITNDTLDLKELDQSEKVVPSEVSSLYKLLRSKTSSPRAWT